jgi:hypothetical protein
MSGFLRKLSAQALGRGAPVRSMARLPYAAFPATFGPMAREQTSSLVAAAPFASAAARPDVLDRTARNEPGIAHGTPPILLPGRQHEARDAPLSAHAMREPADRDLAVATMTPPAGSVAAAPVSTPPLLVPIPPHPAPPPVFASTAAAATAPTADVHRHFTAAEATEVHVSIGRIELTAVHEASPPARRAAPVKPSIQLHEYLARRQRGPS